MQTIIAENQGALPIDPWANYPSVKPTDTPPPKPKPNQEPLEIDLLMDSLKRQIKAAEAQINELIAERLPYDKARDTAHQLSVQAQNYFSLLSTGGSGNLEIDLTEASKMVAAERLAVILNERYRERAPALNEQIRDKQRHIGNLELQLARWQEEEPQLRAEQERLRRNKEWEQEPQRIMQDVEHPGEYIVVLRSGQQIIKRFNDIPVEWRSLILQAKPVETLNY